MTQCVIFRVVARVKETAAGERVIKRYENRKLYDPQARRYVTLEGLGELVARGEDVRVVDQKTGEDLTTVTWPRWCWRGSGSARPPSPARCWPA